MRAADVLPHGFPEFWYGCRLQIAPLAAAGFRVVAPDTRGYNLSSKPEGFEAYGVDLLAADIRGLIGELGAESARVGRSRLGWKHRLDRGDEPPRGGRPTRHPQCGPSAAAFRGADNPSQLRKSWYFFFFATPGLPEQVVPARDWHFFRHFLHDANPPYTAEEFEHYVEAWSQPGAAAGMINYYRESVRQSQKEAAAKLRPLSAPTLVIWGEGFLPRPRPRRAGPRRRAQPRPRGAPGRRLALGPSRRGGARQSAPHRLFRELTVDRMKSMKARAAGPGGGVRARSAWREAHGRAQAPDIDGWALPAGSARRGKRGADAKKPPGHETAQQKRIAALQ